MLKLGTYQHIDSAVEAMVRHAGYAEPSEDELRYGYRHPIDVAKAWKRLRAGEDFCDYTMIQNEFGWSLWHIEEYEVCEDHE